MVYPFDVHVHVGMACIYNVLSGLIIFSISKRLTVPDRKKPVYMQNFRSIPATVIELRFFMKKMTKNTANL